MSKGVELESHTGRPFGTNFGASYAAVPCRHIRNIAEIGPDLIGRSTDKNR